MISMATIDTTWAAIVPQKGKSVVRRVDPSHPVDFFIGYDENGAMQMVLLAEKGVIPSSPMPLFEAWSVN